MDIDFWLKVVILTCGASLAFAIFFFAAMLGSEAVTKLLSAIEHYKRYRHGC